MAAPCTNAPLTTYLNGGSLFTCTETSGDLTFSFNHDVLPTFAGLSLLPSNNSSALASAITVGVGTPGLSFNGNFSSSATLLSSQAELVHFLINSSANVFTGTTFFLSGVSVGTGALGGGTGLAIGQELVCVGGTFTSLPTGLVTTVANGVLPGGTFGCNGVTLVGTAAVSSGPLNAITGVLTLPDLTGATDTAQILFGSASPTIDVIKL